MVQQRLLDRHQEVIGEHAQKDVSLHATLELMEDGPLREALDQAGQVSRIAGIREFFRTADAGILWSRSAQACDADVRAGQSWRGPLPPSPITPRYSGHAPRSSP